jgi:HK97 gp10 family phage protein
MADSIRANVSGIDALSQQLDRFDSALGREALRPALQAAIDVLADAVKRGAQAHSVTGKMAAAVETKVEISSDAQTGQAVVGFGNQAHEARLVELGHREITHSGEDVGQVPAHPFIRPAFDATSEQATDTFVAVLADQIDAIAKG